DRTRFELRTHEPLGRRVDAGSLGRYVPDSVRGLHLGAPSAHPLAIGMVVENLARAVVHPVLARRADVPGLQLASLLVELGVVASDPIHDVALELARDT